MDAPSQPPAVPSPPAEPPMKKPKQNKVSTTKQSNLPFQSSNSSGISPEDHSSEYNEPEKGASKKRKVASKFATNANDSDIPMNNASENDSADKYSDASNKASRKKAAPKGTKVGSQSVTSNDTHMNDADDNPIWEKPSYRWAKKAAEEARSLTVPVKLGDIVEVDKFGGVFQTHKGENTTFEQLLDKSQKGVMIFIFLNAATASCAAQAINFRDNYEYLTSTGLSIYGISENGSRRNASFHNAFSLPFDLLSDKKANLIRVMGFKRPWGPHAICRGLFVIDKEGKVLLQKSGGPDMTLTFAQQMIVEMTRAENVQNDSDVEMIEEC